MRARPYPKYKPSGEAWVPELPESWDLVRLRWLSERYAGGTPDKSNGAFWDEGDIPWLNSGAVNDGYITEPSEYITRAGFLGSSAKWIPKGALVMALAGQGKTKGMVAQLGFAATCNQSMAAIIPIHRIQARYLYWWLTANYFNIRNMAGGEARDGLNLDLLGGIPCPVPEKDAQRAIADFLDRETAKIDTLVAKKRTLIERLKEKRTALISRTVTRGLPPDAARAAGLDPHPKLKPSGIDWLGEIPEHWEIRRLKDAGDLCGGAGFPHEHQGVLGEELPFYKVGDLALASDGRTLSEASHSINREIASDLGARVIPKGAIVYAKIGAALFLNRRRVTSVPCCIDNNMTAFIPRRSCLSSEWAFYWMSTLNFGEFANPGAVPSLSEGYQATLPLLIPYLDEQAAIGSFLDRETTKIDDMVAKVEIAIERLQEYRTALITAAVTGKIDVRGVFA